jgi:porphobilinogen synthase
MYTPYHRPRRLRRNEGIRSMVRETKLQVEDLIYPLFVVPGEGVRNPVESMPGVFQLSLDELVKEAQEVYDLGIPAVILFGIPAYKDAVGSESLHDDAIVAQAVRALKQEIPELYVITDVCFCEYTDHGHCGIISDNDVDNDATLEILGQQAVVHAEAGADMVAPSGMMDGMIAAIREALDDSGHTGVSIMSYGVKYASAYYGPFRDVAESTPQFGDRKTYQMDPANVREALREAELDIQEGADVMMVKPALSYLDVVHALKERTSVPLAVYNVSGEYAMIKAAGAAGWIDEERVMMETLLSMKRAGADLILTYFAKDAAKVLAHN